jgi:hypothetical protein
LRTTCGDLAFRRHVDNDIGEKLRLAGKPAA